MLYSSFIELYRQSNLDVFSFLTAHPDIPIAGQCDVLLADLKLRLSLGDTIRIENYFSECPTVVADLALKLKLVAGDFQARLDYGESPSIDDYADRFPDLADALRDRLSATVLPMPEDVEAHLPSTIDPSMNPHVDTILTESQPTAGGKFLPGDRFGDYEIEGEIARGGMGVVFKARQVSLNRPVALKMILSSRLANEEMIQRFRAEAESAARLEHAGIVPIFEVGEIAEQHFFSMGLVEGGSLADLRGKSSVTGERAAAITKTVAEAVQYAHSRNIVHRDLKPANVLLDLDGRPKVTDFGLAKNIQEESGLTVTGVVMGTPSYMAPEQASGTMDAVGPLADVYALGGILYFLLTGHAPFEGSNSIDIIQHVLSKEPVSPIQHDSEVDLDLSTICLKCLEKDPARRYDSAGELAEELKLYLEGRPISARPVGQWERGWRWCKRNPLITALSLLVMVSLISGLAGSSYFAFRMWDEAIRADQNRDAALKNQQESVRSAQIAMKAKRQAEERQYDAVLSKTNLYLSTAHTTNGWTWEIIDDLRALSQLDIGKRDHAKVRSLLLRALMELDVRKVGTVPLQNKKTHAEDLCFDQAGKTLFIAESKGVPTCHLTGIDVSSLKTLERYELRTVDLNYLTRLVQSQKKFQTGFRAVAVSPDGKWIAAGGRFGEIWLWRRNSTASAPITLQSNGAEVFQLVFSPDSKTLYTSTKDKGAGIRIWRLTDEWSLERTLENGGYDFCLSHDGQRLAMRSDNSLLVMDTDTWDILTSAEAGFRPQFSRDDTCLFTVESTTLSVLASDTCEYYSRFGDSQFDGAGHFRGDRPQPLGNTLYCVTCGGGKEGAWIYDPENQLRVLAIPTPGLTGPDFAVSPDGKMLAVAEAHSVGLYEVRLPIDCQTKPSLGTIVRDLEFSQDSSDLSVLRSSWGKQLFTTEIDSYRIEDMAVSKRWRTFHTDDGGLYHSLDADSRMEISAGLKSNQTLCAEPQLGVHVRNDQGQVFFPMESFDLRHSSLKVAFAAKVPNSVRVSVGKQIPYLEKRGSNALQVRIDDSVSDQLPRMISKSDQYQLFVNVLTPRRTAPHVNLRAQVGGQNWIQPEVSAWIHSNERAQTISCGVLNKEQLTGQVFVKLFIENLFEKDRRKPEIVLDAVLLVAKPDARTKPLDVPRGPVGVSQDGEQFWAGINVETLGSWNWPDGECLYPYNDRVQAILRGRSGIDAFAVSRETIAIGSRSGAVAFLDAKTGETIKTVTGPGGGILFVDFAALRRVLLATSTGHIGLLDWESGSFQPISRNQKSIFRFLASRDQKMLCLAAKEGDIQLLREKNGVWGDYLRLGPFSNPPAAIALSPDGRYLAFATTGHRTNAHVIDLERLEHYMEQLLL